MPPQAADEACVDSPDQTPLLLEKTLGQGAGAAVHFGL